MNTEVLAALDRPVLHHVGIVVASEKAALLQMKRLGLLEDYRGHVPAWNVLCIFAQGHGGSPLEFVVPEAPGPLRDFNKGLGGLHHLAFVVPDLLQATARLAAIGVQLLEPQPVRGAGAFLCNFVPPLYTRAYAIELVQLLPAA